MCLQRGGMGMLPVAANLACVWASTDDGDPAGALLLLDALQQLHPDEPVVLRAQGMVRMRQAKWPQAIIVLERYAARCPDDPWAHRTLAAAYQQTGDAARAAEHRRLGATTRPAPSPASRPAFGS